MAAQFCSLFSVIFISERRLFLRRPGEAAIQEGLPAPLCSVSDVIQRFCARAKRLTARRARVINSGASKRVFVTMAGHDMHTNACGFSNSWSSLMYLAPSDFLGLEQLTSSCRSRAVEASRTHLKSSRSDPIAPIATLRSACHCLLPPLYSFARGLRRSFNRSKSVGSHRSSSNTSASVVLLQLENLLCPIKPLPMRIRTL